MRDRRVSALILRVVDGPDRGRIVRFERQVEIGRAAGADLQLEDERVSGRHARVVATRAGATVEDLGSTNGTYVNDRRIDASVKVGEGARIRVGHSTMSVEPDEPSTPTDSVASIHPRTPYRFARRARPRVPKRAVVAAIVAIMLCAAVIAVAAITAASNAPTQPKTNPPAPRGPDGTVSFRVPSRNHVRGHVHYQQSPPVGGDHFPVYQNCGFYPYALETTEQGVHSLEHGAVWITYRPGLAEADMRVLRDLAHRHSYVLASAWPGLATPVVASAWGRQLALPSVRDPRLTQFVQTFERGAQAPERGERCDDGAGIP